jgi:uncharacterized protein
MKKNAAYWIDRLQLNTHAEGGYYKEVYRSPITIVQENLPAGFHGPRNISTSIYFLLNGNQFSAFHRIASDELWHFYAGDCLVIYEIESDGKLNQHLLGSNPDRGEVFQTAIKAGNWFASIPESGSDYSLVGCTVSPGFDFADFELASGVALEARFPQHKMLINSMTRG